MTRETGATRVFDPLVFDSEGSETLRNPLARIELAASRLEREVRTPGERAWVRVIRDAVADLDRRVGAGPLWDRGAGPCTPLSELLQDLELRLRSAMHARGIAIVAELPRGRDPTPETWRARRAGLALVRVAAGCAPTRIAIRALVREDPSRWGIEVQWAHGCEDSDATASEPLRQVRADCDAALEFGPRALRFWFDEGQRI